MGDSSRNLTLTVLVENTAGQRGLLGEHGLAIWVDTGDSRVLFDTGQGLTLRHNAEALGVELRTADSVVLSHGHYDHADGLATVGERLSQVRLFVHPEAFQPRYSAHDPAAPRAVGCALVGLVRARALVASVVQTRAFTEVARGVWATGEIPRRNEFERASDHFFLDESLTKPDPFLDDQALVVQTRRGLVVVLGCGHAGVVNTLDHVAEQTGEQRFHMVLGGMHLLDGSRARIEQTVAALKRYRVQRVGPAHCTGLAATAEFQRAWGSDCLAVQAGSRVRV